jgi:hypothetical protein
MALQVKSGYQNLESTCAPRCADSEKKSLQTKALVADIALGVGVLSLGTSLVYWLIQKPTPTPTTHVSFQPKQDGVMVGISSVFQLPLTNDCQQWTKPSASSIQLSFWNYSPCAADFRHPH